MAERRKEEVGEGDKYSNNPTAKLIWQSLIRVPGRKYRNRATTHCQHGSRTLSPLRRGRRCSGRRSTRGGSR